MAQSGRDDDGGRMRLLRSALMIVMVVGFAMVVYGLFQTKVVCHEPYSAVSGSCCFDRNVNGVCDNDECLPEVTYGTNASGDCFEFPNTCLPDGFVSVESCPDASCFDGIQNCHEGECETGIDCGGPCTIKVIATCLDEEKNQDEEGIDCGGSCPPCILRKEKSTCFDGIQNQNETSIDCGGPCPPCLPTCYDGIKNQDEENVDCGGPCEPCVSQPKDKLIWTINLTEKVNDVSIGSNASIIVFGGLDNKVYAYYLNKTKAWEYRTRGNIMFVGVSDNGASTIAASDDNYVYAFRNATRALPATTYYKRFRLGELKSMDVAGSGYTVVAGSAYDENVTVDGSYREDYIYKMNNQAEVISSHATDRDVTDVAISPSGNRWAGISDDKLFINGREINMGWLFTFDYLEIIDASDYGVVVANNDNIYYVTGSEVAWTYNTTRVNDVSISNDNKIIVGTDKAVMIDSAMNDVWSYDINHSALKVEVSRSGNLVAVFFENRYLYMFDGAGKLKWRFFTGDRILSMEFSPDDTYLITGSHGGAVHLFAV